MNLPQLRIEIEEKRIYGLDILRFWAILLVIISHSRTFIEHFLPNFTPYLKVGKYGVELFFVLSGFLIGRILMKIVLNEGLNSKSVRRFWSRRWFRTLPAYFATLILLFIVQYFYNAGQENFSYKYLLFIQNFTTEIPDFFNVSWSLSIEEWFYLSLPFVIFLGIALSGSKERGLLVATFFFFITFFILRLFKILNSDMNIERIVIYRLDSMAYGIFMAYLFTFKKDFFLGKARVMFKIGIVLTMLSLILYYIYRLEVDWHQIIHFPLTSIGFALLLPFATTIKKRALTVPQKFISRVSIISYSMYLLHVDFAMRPLKYLGLKMEWFDNVLYTLILLTIYFLLSYILAFLSYLLIEQPFLNLRDKYFPSRKVL